MFSLEEMLNRIKGIKNEKQLTNEMLSKETEIPLGTLSKILSGNTKDPQMSNIMKIAKALGVTADYLVYGEDDKGYSEHEQAVIRAYRAQPEMQPAVDRLLGIADHLEEKRSDSTNIGADISETVSKAAEAFSQVTRQK
ncbi:MAG: helix-turn-helix domain-containing protein [Candidatus Ornithomonoglobus sp.]